MEGWNRFVSANLPVTAKRLPRAARWIALLVGAISQLPASVVYSILAWQNAMREILKQTETESNVMASLGSLSMAFLFVVGILNDRYGSQFLNIFAGAFMAVSSLLLALATAPNGQGLRPFFAANLWLVDILYLLLGTGGAMMMIISFVPTIANFSPRHHGVIVGILDGMYNAGPAFFSTIYNLGFTDGFVKVGQEGQQNLSGFFYTVFAIATLVNAAAFLFMGKVASVDNSEEHSSNEDSETLSILPKQEDTGDLEPVSNQFADYPFEQFSLTRVIRRLNFWLFVLQFAVNVAVQETWRNNLQTYWRSFNMNEYDLAYSLMIMGFTVTTSICSGIISDRLVVKGVPRTFTLFLPLLFQTIMFSISMFHGDNTGVLIVTCLALSMSIGATWTLPYVLLQDLFGSKHVGAILGLTFLPTAILVFPVSIGFSSLYDAAIEKPGEMYCFGLRCFKWSFLMFSILSLLCLILLIWLTVNMYANAAMRTAGKTRNTETTRDSGTIGNNSNIGNSVSGTFSIKTESQDGS